MLYKSVFEVEIKRYVAVRIRNRFPAYGRLDYVAVQSSHIYCVRSSASEYYFSLISANGLFCNGFNVSGNFRRNIYRRIRQNNLSREVRSRVFQYFGLLVRRYFYRVIARSVPTELSVFEYVFRKYRVGKHGCIDYVIEVSSDFFNVGCRISVYVRPCAVGISNVSDYAHIERSVRFARIDYETCPRIIAFLVYFVFVCDLYTGGSARSRCRFRSGEKRFIVVIHLIERRAGSDKETKSYVLGFNSIRKTLFHFYFETRSDLIVRPERKARIIHNESRGI